VCVRWKQWRRLGGREGSFPLWVDVQKLCNMCAFIVVELLRITRQIHCKAVEQRATLIHRQYGNGLPSPGSAMPRLAKSVLVDVDMASSGRRSSPGSLNSTLGEEDPFPGLWKPLLCHFSAHHAVLFQFVRNCCRCIQLCCGPIWFLFGLTAIIFDAIIVLLIKF